MALTKLFIINPHSFPFPLKVLQIRALVGVSPPYGQCRLFKEHLSGVETLSLRWIEAHAFDFG
jgi:hypothetical protein